MKDQHTLIKGYRDLTQEEIDLMNEGKALGLQVEAWLEKLKGMESTDKGALQTGITTLKTGFMWAIRSIAKPNGF